MAKNNLYKSNIKQSLSRCEANLLKHSDPEKIEIIKKQIYDYEKFLKDGIPEGHNSIYAPLQDDDSEYLSTGQGGL